MSDILSSVGSFFTNNGKGLNSLLGLAGAGTNVYSGIQNFLTQRQQQQNQSYISNLVKDPTKMAAAAASYQQPLSAGLTDELQNQVQGTLAQQGLGSSPAAITSALTQAEAPYIQQNQSTALNTLLSSLGLLGSSKGTTLPYVNLSGIMKQLQLQNNTNPLNGSGYNPESFSTPDNPYTDYSTGDESAPFGLAA
jgi:hypothetical protein